MCETAFVLGIVALLATVAACGGDDDGDHSTETATTSTTITPTAPPSVAPTDTAGPVRTPTPPPGPAPGEDPLGDQLLYIALGDSLSAGKGATDAKRTAWVPLVAYGLGDRYELLNLGVAGHDSGELIEEGPLDQALAEIASRTTDGAPGNEVAAITLEIGGNDLLDLYDDLVLTGDCPSVEEALQRQQCIDGLQDALDGYGPNLAYILDALQQAAPDVPVFLMTLYNSFSGGARTLDEIGALALEGDPDTPFPEGLNDIIRAEAAGHPGVVLVEWYGIFVGEQFEYISLDFIHPNDTGQRVLADAVLAAMADAGLP